MVRLGKNIERSILLIIIYELFYILYLLNFLILINRCLSKMLRLKSLYN